MCLLVHNFSQISEYMYVMQEELYQVRKNILSNEEGKNYPLSY